MSGYRLSLVVSLLVGCGRTAVIPFPLARDAGSVPPDAGRPVLDGGADGGALAPVSFEGFCFDPHWCYEYPLPIVGTPTASFSAGPGDVWLFGYRLRAFLHWDGRVWKGVPIDQQSDEFGTPNAAWGSGANDIWTAGEHGILYHWNGGTWARFSIGTDRIRLTGIWGSAPDDVWAVGNDDSGQESIGLVMHWDGRSWSRIQGDPNAPDGAQLYYLYGLRGRSDKVYMLADESPHTDATDVFTYDAASMTWSKFSVRDLIVTDIAPLDDGKFVLCVPVGPNGAWFGDGASWQPMAGMKHCKALWTDGHEVWAGGDGLIHWTAEGSTSFLPTEQVFSIQAKSRDHVWMSGANGRIYDWDGQRLQTRDSGVGDDLRQVIAVSDTEAWAVGYQDALVHFGHRQALAPTHTTPRLWGGVLTGSGQSAWATFSSCGLAIHDSPNTGGPPCAVVFDGRSWTTIPLPTFADTIQLFGHVAVISNRRGETFVGGANGWSPIDGGYDAWAASPTSIYASDAHWDGTKWTPLPSPDRWQPTLTWGTGEDDIWRSFEYTTPGSVLDGLDAYDGLGHWDGRAWTYFDAGGTPYGLGSGEQVAAIDPNNIWVRSAYPYWQHFDGTSWTPDPRWPSTVGGVVGISLSDLWAASSTTGNMLHWNGSAWNPAFNNEPAGIRLPRDGLSDGGLFIIWAGGGGSGIGRFSH